MRRFRYPHDMRGNLGIQMGGHRHTGRPSDRCRAEPARNTANAHEIRHDEIAGLLLKCHVQIAGAIEIFADLNRRLKIGGQLCITVEIVIDDRLFDPAEAQPINHLAPHHRLGET